MTTICNLKSQRTLREYNLISLAHGFASVELRNPSASENSAEFEVAADEVTNVLQVEGYVMPSGIGYDLDELAALEDMEQDARCDAMMYNDLRHGG